MAARWLPNNEEFFVGLVRPLEASESNLNSASYDNSEFLFRRLDAHEKTLSTLLTVLTSLHDSRSSRMNKSLHSLALTRMSFRDFPSRHEMMGGSLKISLSCGLIFYNCHFPMSVSFRLGNAGWYCVTKGSIFLGAVLFFCASDISLSENLISERCFSTILAG